MFGLSLERLLYIVPAIVVALTFHEYAHARTAYAFGDTTARDAGRLTFNPLKHLDPVGTLLLIIAGFGWAKPVPINPFLFGDNRKRKLMAVSAAGPLMNVVEALAGAALLALIVKNAGVGSALIYYFIGFLSYFVMINAVLAVFNLLPIPPLDGSKILAGLLPARQLNIVLTLERYGFIILLALVFIPDILSMFGLPRIDILGTLIGVPATWLVNVIYGAVGL
ncbi:MAG: site-2 protease family protein [Bacillota bacterium]|nr:site-2 protease family protein [Bacillota bacterium]